MIDSELNTLFVFWGPPQSGDGALSFTDNNAYSIVSTIGSGLNVDVSGDNGLTDGSITIIQSAGGLVQGFQEGIDAENDGSGAMTIDISGDVTGTNFTEKID